MVAILVCVARLVQLMVFQADKIQNKVERQWTREVSVAPLRGSILDRNGEILAATTTTQSILLYPKEIKDAGEVADLLAPILEMDRQKIYEVASDTSKVEAWLKRHITEDQVTQIRALNLKGVGFFFRYTKRVYPYGSFLSQVLGYTSSDGAGQEGLERAYNKYLAGYPGTMLTQVDANGRTVEGSEQTYIDALDGYNVVLTIDAVIQSFAENAAREALEVNQAKSVCAIVMDPKNANILAMVNYPEADLNQLDRSDLSALADISRNTAVTDAFEPGSDLQDHHDGSGD
ncbi:MAG: penicillin-binding transpeptidase domain-containing protein [Christensenellaceae bacterium]